MTLARLSVLFTALIAVLVTTLFARIFLDEWQRYQSLDAGLVSMEAASQALEVAEKLALERGPAHVLMAGDDKAHSEQRTALAETRARSDAAMVRLMDYLQIYGRAQDRAAVPVLTSTAVALDDARREIDRLADLPLDRRNPAEVRRALQDMFTVIPPLMDAHTRLSRNATDLVRPVSEGMAGARMCAELREYASQLASPLALALTTGQRLTYDDHRRIAFLYGRVVELQEQVERPLLQLPAEAPTHLALADMQQRYFESGLSLVFQLEERSRLHQPYGMDTPTFANRYIDNMHSILELRDVLVQDAFAEMRKARATARQRMLVTGGLSGSILLVLAGVVFILQRRVVQPLLAAAQSLRDIADGQLDRTVPVSLRHDEVGAVQQALYRLRNGAVEKRQLEHERIHLIEDLERLSLTDPLTGILNRRAFTEALRTCASRADAQQLPIAVLLFDIDHFKSVNDRHGHESGDRVLMRVAAVSQHLLRAGEIVARYGGEEFIVLLMHASPGGALRTAERLRTGIEAARITLQDGREVRVTASFGVATAPNALCNLEDLLRAADTALYAAKTQGRNRTVAALDPDCQVS